MRCETKKYLYDIQKAAENIQTFVAGKTFSDYQQDVMLRSAVERQFGIIGEALVQMTKIDLPTAAQIPEYRRIIAFRNILIHGYAEVDDRIVWDIICEKLPVLLGAVQKLLRS
ncbi:MAG: DUF86 domain-containing protein [Thermoguttaceae bacterium]|nr:DUF86 domain-containing protein [Thermoguttaceae bacterium]MDW8038534.1 DUF86 domain-containing protein [Thermoguttaceae bacterium]